MCKDILCNICLTYEGKAVHMQAKGDYFKCPECGAELWPRDMNFANHWEKERQQNLMYKAMSLQEGEQIKGGVNNGKGRRKANNKKTLAQINAGLSINFESR